ncbi:Rieske 2Fe-2S domain-containing protein [Scytonema sp. PCC 10023]|uniref:aromatic ring-hydroxylating dioxygenase subunit alpha n=1 Tax=Scytonema sp. PCC 10023 TaxID=1680591 RepID=UPI0039C6C394
MDAILMVQDQILLNNWHVIAHSQDLQPGTILQKRLLGEDIVLWHNGDKAFAWQDFCPHRGARLSLGWVEKDNLVCPYHGLAYNTEGKCVLVPASPDQPPPARACIRTYHIQERYGLLWVCLGTPQNDIPRCPDWEDSSFRKILCGPYHFKSSPLRVIENLIDPAHFPFVHKGMFADSSRPELTHYDLESHPDGITFKFGIWELDLKSGDSSAPMLFNTYQYRVCHPLTGYFQQRGEDDNCLSLFFMVTPVDQEECILCYWLLDNFLHEIPDSAFQALEDQIMSQDISIVESQRPRRLPLDLQAEFHLPSDRYSVAYRKWLKQQGVTFGSI